MKRSLIIGFLSLCSALTVSAADAYFFNDTDLVSPPANAPVINAYAWVNRALFDVTTVNGSGLELPYESQNTLFFTNLASMIGNPGFRFFDNVAGQRRWMDTWDCEGPISTDSSSVFSSAGTIFVSSFGNFFGFNSQSSVLLVQATNITSPAILRSGAQGLIHLEGKTLNLGRSGLRTGSAVESSQIFGVGFLLSSNYVNDFGIFDLWWGSGTNNTINGKGPGMRLDGFGNPFFNLPTPESPSHEVIETFGGFNSTFIESIPRFNFFNFNTNNFYGAAVFTNQTGPTNFIIQVVFYPTNNTDLTTEVRFVNDFVLGPTIPTVAIHSVDNDIVDDAAETSSVYLSDGLALSTNIYLAHNIGPPTHRPVNMVVSRLEPFDFQFSSPGNAVFDPTMIWRPSYTFNVVTNLYSAYDAQVASVTTASGLSGDVTNYPGRVEIMGSEVNLELARIRAESSFILHATNNLIGNHIAQVNAPFVNFDATSVAPLLVISNIAPPTVRRFQGDIAAWSGTWFNYDNITNFTTNEVFTTNSGVITTNITMTTNYFNPQIFFHVLIVDPNITSTVPVLVNEFAAHAANIMISDNLVIGKSFLADGPGLCIKVGVTMPFGSSWGTTNLKQVVNFTNDGGINIPQLANAGLDRAEPYQNYINRGTNTASTFFIRTTNFENTGSMIASGGLLQIDTLSGSMMGRPLSIVSNVTTSTFLSVSNLGSTNFVLITNTLVLTNIFTNEFGARLQGNSAVRIFAQDLAVSNSLVIGQGGLLLSVTNSLRDSGLIQTNHWTTSSGFDMLTRPNSSDLMGTYLQSRRGPFQVASHTWCAENRGVSIMGYSNNLALGKLTLDGGNNSLFRFAAPAGQSDKALYVDYLELLNHATNYNTGALDIASNLTIYFANANLNPVKLDGSNGGRLRWIQSFTGPLSSTNITYPSGKVYTFNSALG